MDENQKSNGLVPLWYGRRERGGSLSRTAERLLLACCFAVLLVPAFAPENTLYEVVGRALGLGGGTGMSYAIVRYGRHKFVGAVLLLFYGGSSLAWITLGLISAAMRQ